ncbi:MAG: Mu transposase C-terminal domain-containing protein [Parvibaculum sp.]|nr:Mu transposase C-terminal domain-containing protein [Parvibaculum sp.]
MTGMGTDLAIQHIAINHGIKIRTIYLWKKKVQGLAPSDWAPALAPRHVGRVAEVELEPAAWDQLRADYLRPSAPNFTDCYRRLQHRAGTEGWTLPSPRTLERRLAAIPEQTRIFFREGVDALKRLYPAQVRDRSSYHALEAVNADGHVWDVFVRFPDGTVGRPAMVAFQDLYSGKILSWRLNKHSNKETVLLAFGDLVETYGIPTHCYLDNGRDFASKWVSGGTPNRYRFKIKENEPQGVLTMLGVEVHWTTPYSGQSKPIERAFRDFAQALAKHPAFEGAYTGNKPDAKPENYGSKAVPYDQFEQIVAEGIAEHNARLGRRSLVCAGKLSFDTAFALSYAQSEIRKATAEQRRLWLLAAEGVTVRKTAHIELSGNKYWCEELLEFIGQKVVIRFDPEDLHAGVHVYRLDGVYVAEARCVELTGFGDQAAARDHARGRRQWMRAVREKAQREINMSLDELVAALPTIEKDERKVEPKVVRPIFGNLAVKATAQEEEEDDRFAEAFGRGVDLLASGVISFRPKEKGGA